VEEKKKSFKRAGKFEQTKSVYAICESKNQQRFSATKSRDNIDEVTLKGRNKNTSK
jgi:hypothetical protein